MNPRLASLLAVAGTIAVGGVTYSVLVRQPSNVTMAELRDAGLLEAGPPGVLECPEVAGKAALRRYTRQGWPLRQGQRYVWVARVVVLLPDGGLPQGGAALIAPSGAPDDLAPDVADGGEDDDVDQQEVVEPDRCVLKPCPYPVPTLPDGGWPYRRSDGGAPGSLCNRPAAATLLPQPCARAVCYTDDGGIDDVGWDGKGACWRNLPADPGPDGGPRWIGCWNVIEAPYAVGPGCQPVSCTIRAGHDPWRDL